MDAIARPSKKTIARRFAKAAHDYPHAAVVQKRICEKLLLKITQTQPFDLVVEIGAGSGGLTRLLTQKITSRNWIINELCPERRETLATLVPQGEIIIADGENLALNQSANLIISANTVQWFAAPLAFPQWAKNHLSPSGQLIFNTFLPNHFSEIRMLTQQGLHYPSLGEWQAALQEQFSTVEWEIFSQTLYFSNPWDVLTHLRKTGVTAAGSWRWTKSRLRNFSQRYPRTEKGCPLSYHAVLFKGMMD